MKNKKIIMGIIIVLSAIIFLIGMTKEVRAADEQGNFVIVLDPGHGDNDPGAVAGGIREADVNFKIAYYAKQELEQYEGVKVFLTRYNDCPSIYDRVEIAKRYQADLLVSLHINSGASNARGAAIWVTQDNTQIEYHQKAAQAASQILNRISNVGIYNNGVQIRTGKPDEWYDSGVVQDYYGIIRYAQRVKMRSLLVEHCFISNAQDRWFINSDDRIRQLAQADVQGIVEAYQLRKKGQGSVPVKSIKIDTTTELNLEMTQDNPQPLSYLNMLFNPSNASNKEIEWYSSNPNIVRVYEGYIRGLQEGEVTIKAISKNNQRMATCKVIVTKPTVPLQNISVDKEQRNINIDGNELIAVKFNPSNSTDQKLYWTSSNPEIVRVWDGYIRGLKEGVSIITATSRAGGKKTSCKVIVKDQNKVYVENIIPEQEEYTIGINEGIKINYEYLPKDSENTDFSWTSSNPDVLRVYWNNIRGLKEGTSEIIIRTPEGITEKRIKVNVKNIKVEQIVLEQEEYTIGLNEVIDINYDYLPKNATNTDFSWTASDKTGISVYWNKVRGLKEGVFYMIVKTPDGSLEKRIKINVVDRNSVKVEQIIPEQEEYTIGINEVIDINYSYLPNDATNVDFSWTASDKTGISVYWNKVRGLKEGTFDIIVRTPEGFLEKRIKINVIDKSKIKVEQIIPEQEEYTIRVNEVIDINYSYLPNDATNIDFSWTASDKTGISVYWNKVRGLKEGTFYIIVKTPDNLLEKRIKIIVQK
ncbi:MAG: hypothetical protein HFJ34_06750 [Clostridia bacterium]|nr:hypothetical protein [Clostridia bacterium]